MKIKGIPSSQINNIYKFLKSTKSFGQIAGIPVNIQMNWFPSIFLVTWSIAGGYFPNQYPQWEIKTYWSVGLLTAGLFFLSVLLHELGHSIIAVRQGIRVESITLFLLGGMAQIAWEPTTPGAEARVVAAGPLTSFLLAGVFYLVRVAAATYPQIAAAALYMTYVNLILAIFNLIPGFPLDGGRLLRALLWKLVGHYARATQWAEIISLIFSISLLFFGIFAFFSGQFFVGFWLMLIGCYLSYLSKDGINKQSRAQKQMDHNPNVKDLPIFRKQPGILFEDSKQE